MTSQSNTSQSTFSYPPDDARIPPFIFHIWMLAFAAIAHYLLLIQWELMGAEGVETGLMSPFTLTLAIFVAAYLGLAGVRYRNAIDAINMLTSTVESIGLQIRNLETEKDRKACHLAFEHLLRSIYVAVKQMDRPEFDYVEALIKCNDCFRKAGLDRSLLSGNGALNRFLLARAQIKSTVSVPMSRTLKWACLAMFPFAALSFALYLLSMDLSPFIQALILGSFCYGVWLVIVVAEDLGKPFGVGMSLVAMRERFGTYEARLRLFSARKSE